LIENFAHSIGFGKGHVIIPLIENSLLAGKVDEENGKRKGKRKNCEPLCRHNQSRFIGIIVWHIFLHKLSGLSERVTRLWYHYYYDYYYLCSISFDLRARGELIHCAAYGYYLCNKANTQAISFCRRQKAPKE